MSKLSIHYFDFPGGRAEPARIALRYAGIDFEDVRFSPKELAERAKDYPLGKVPVMDVEGQRVTQSNAINRYVGKLTGLYPNDPIQALLCDEALDAAEELTAKVAETFSLQGEELKAAREKLCATVFPAYLTFFSKKLAQAGDYFADNRLTIADLRVMMLLRHLCSGALDHVPADLADKHAPNLQDYLQRVSQHEVFVKGHAS
ncbi:glutathione S-transferase family protein [Vibrio fluvialis]|uniref:glutathione S-transferase family protein n=1 Tax=Vibrio fluvialis TaxID=676 RepID=UPI00192BE89A|nr:glutathione S-transferase family protein [Vibrio fluvialis]MBL4286010.1 glutathione S-transferase family protein [Vibrio fluvialis]MBL4290269.1 glutathione S-transferase family protein [Vibrio fluvialis]MCE7601180.1 glutathione S-transferase family protein [Vibrio fluvialis]